MKIKGKTLDNWLCFYLSERRVLAEVCKLQNLFCTNTDLTEQSFSNMERDVYEILIVGIWRIHPGFSTAVWNI